MPYELKLPDLGEGVHEGEIVRWLVREGQPVRENPPLVEVMTDKVTAEIPSPTHGTVQRIAVAEGAVVPVGTLLVTIGDAASPDGQVQEPAPREVAPRREPVRDGTEPTVRQPEAKEGERVLAVPAVRKLAKDLGVELA